MPWPPSGQKLIFACEDGSPRWASSQPCSPYSRSYTPESNPLAALVLKILFIATPLAASGLATIVSQIFSAGDWLVTRAGAEEILKEILYRTILQNTPTRRMWLEERLGEIQRSVFRGMNGEMILKPYKGPIPPPPRFDPNIQITIRFKQYLDGDEYFRFKLENQLSWHTKEINRRQKERMNLKIYTL